MSSFFGEPSRRSTTLVSQREGNIITMEAFDFLWKIHDKVDHIQYNGLTWDNMCEYKQLNDESCIVDGPTQFWSNNKTLYDMTVLNEVDLINAISSPVYPSGRKVNRESIFGKITTSEDNKIIGAVGMSQAYGFSSKFESAVEGTQLILYVYE